MANVPFTQPWADDLRDAINASADYREASRGWTWPIALVLEAAPDLGFPHDAAIVLDLDGGDCRAATALPASEATAPYVIRGGYAAWKQLSLGTLDPVAAMMQGRLRVTGSLATLMMHARSAKALVACATRVPTAYPDEGAAST